VQGGGGGDESDVTGGGDESNVTTIDRHDRRDTIDGHDTCALYATHATCALYHHATCPLYHHYLREMASMNALLHSMQQWLGLVEVALVGLKGVSPEVQTIIDAFCLDTVPTQWSRLAYTSCRPLAAWFNDLVHRCDSLHDWCTKRVTPPVVWLSGLMHPEGFVTAVMMHLARVHDWPLAETLLCTEVLQHFPDEFVGDEAVGPLGVRVHGFHVDKACWDMERGLLCCVPPGHLGAAEMPVILLKVSLVCALLTFGSTDLFAISSGCPSSHVLAHTCHKRAR